LVQQAFENFNPQNLIANSNANPTGSDGGQMQNSPGRARFHANSHGNDMGQEFPPLAENLNSRFASSSNFQQENPLQVNNPDGQTSHPSDIGPYMDQSLNELDNGTMGGFEGPQMQGSEEYLAENANSGLEGNVVHGDPRLYGLDSKDSDAIKQLVDFGFGYNQSLEAYLSCGKDEAMAANFLLENPTFGMS
jgi:hypothetical protein